MPKAKLKQPPRKEISASEHATPSKDGEKEGVLSSASRDTEGISRDECHNAVVSTLNTSAEESPNLCHSSQVEPPNLEDDTNSEMGNHPQVSVERDTAILVDDPSSLITMSEVDADWNFTDHTKLSEVESMDFELHPFSNVLPDPGAKNAHKFLPKIKPRPRVGTTPDIASASNDMIEKSDELPTSCANEVQSFKRSGDGSSRLNQPTNLPLPFSEDNSSFEAVIPPQLDSPDAMLSEVANHDGETADIFCGLESLDDFLTQAATDTDPTSEIPVHGELTDAAGSPTLADFLRADVSGEKEDASKRQEDGSSSPSLSKDKRSSIAVEKDMGSNSSRQLRKHASRRPANNPANGDVDNDDDLDPPYNPNRDELEDNDDEFEVDDSSKKERSASNSKKKSAAKNGKTPRKRKKANEDLEKNTEQPRKKFSHSTRRKKRCVDKALLEIPEDELDPLTLPIKDIILLAEYRERLAKKEASTSKTSLPKQSGGDSLHEAGYNNEEMLGPEDDRDPDDDEARESIPTAASLFNYQSFMDKAPRGKWSKQDTELFYEGITQFGTDFSMIQLLFPDRTRHQIKLKYKKEERQHPLQLSDAVSSRTKDHSHFKLLIERLQQASTKAKDQDPYGDASDFMTGTEVEDLTPETNNEVGKTEQDANAEDANVKDQDDANIKDQEDANVKDQEDSVAFHSPEPDDDDEDDFSWYKSAP
ncbi:putative transcription factor MYB/SANT family [Lupinus albus]|uniref:Putative transcription factor MYB/SANT family n=1 Tax=Lupinus albus TaxID=3870 RepID=A0A6A4PS87_LUPAL|nr:putative transcription factor MYB/SANT family [Lupinus albus]